MSLLTIQPMTQKARKEYSDYWGVEVGDVFYCDECQVWTHCNEDEMARCGC